MVKQVARAFETIKKAMKNLNKPLRSGIVEPVKLSENIARSLCSGFFNNTCICNGSTIRAGFTQLPIKETESFVIHPSSVLGICDTHNESTWVVYHEALKTSNNFLRIVTRIKAEWLQEEAPEWFKDVQCDATLKSRKFLEENLTIGSIRYALLANEQIFLKNLRKEFPQTVIYIPKQQSSTLPVQIFSPPEEILGAKQRLQEWKQTQINQDTRDHNLKSIFYQITIGSGIVIKNAQQHHWRKLWYEVNLPISATKQQLKNLDTIRYTTRTNQQGNTIGHLIFSSKKTAEAAIKKLSTNEPSIYWDLRPWNDITSLRLQAYLFKYKNETELEFSRAIEKHRTIACLVFQTPYVAIFQFMNKQSIREAIYTTRLQQQNRATLRKVPPVMIDKLQDYVNNFYSGIVLSQNGKNSVCILLQDKYCSNVLDILIPVVDHISQLVAPIRVQFDEGLLSDVEKNRKNWEENYEVQIYQEKKPSILEICGFYKERERFRVYFMDWCRTHTKDILYKDQIKVDLQALKKIQNFNLSTISIDVTSGTVFLETRDKMKLLAIKELIKDLQGETLLVCNNCSNPCILSKAKILSICGHLYCRLCWKQLVNQSSFPIQCNIRNCSDPVAIQDFDMKLDQLVEKAFKNYIQENTTDFVACTTPGCKYVFSKAQKLDKCRLCFLPRKIVMLNKYFQD
jgi:hypothetical protein